MVNVADCTDVNVWFVSFKVYTKKAEPVMRFELMTSSLPRKRSTPELHWRSVYVFERKTRFEPATLSLEG